ncbi:hypothetical protein V6Z12_A13G227900 [Gossypium hirsutum]
MMTEGFEGSSIHSKHSTFCHTNRQHCKVEKLLALHWTLQLLYCHMSSPIQHVIEAKYMLYIVVFIYILW